MSMLFAHSWGDCGPDSVGNRTGPEENGAPA